MNFNQLLDRLKMDHLQASLDTLCEHASKADLNYRELLEQVLSQEWGGRHQRGFESRLKQARLRWEKALEQFDFSIQPSIDKMTLRELSGLGFVERCENVVLLGPPGVGKPHLAAALAVKAAEAGHRVPSMSLGRLDRQLQQLTHPRVLVLDEIGYPPMARDEASMFFRLANRRYERACIILTSNKSFTD